MLVSIVTTCYQAEKCIEKTIRSVLSQTFDNFEYIIMDGGSTDKTMQLVSSYASAFSKRSIPFYYYTQKDHGIYDGMNHGVSHCTGTFINFMNADDLFYSDSTLSKLFSNRDLSDTDILYGDALEFEYGRYYYFPKDLNRIECAMPFSHQSVFARRSLLLRFPFHAEYSIGSDYNFLLDVFQSKGRFTDSHMPVCIVSRDGISSVDLYHTFVETVKIQEAHGIHRFTDTQYKHKLQTYKFKQFVMDHFPPFLLQSIRRFQRKTRGQDQEAR